MAPDPSNPTNHRQIVRAALDRTLQTVANLTSNLEDLLQALDADTDNQQLQFDTSSTTLTVVPELEPKLQRQRRNDEFPNAIKPWSEADDAELRQAFKWKLTDEAIGEFMGRTPEAIKKRRQRLGMRREF